MSLPLPVVPGAWLEWSLAGTYVLIVAVWYAAQEEQDRRRAAEDAQRSQAKEQAKVQREEMRKEMLGEK